MTQLECLQALYVASCAYKRLFRAIEIIMDIKCELSKTEMCKKRQ